MPGDHTQQGRLSLSVRTDQRDLITAVYFSFGVFGNGDAAKLFGSMFKCCQHRPGCLSTWKLMRRLGLSISTCSTCSKFVEPLHGTLRCGCSFDALALNRSIKPFLLSYIVLLVFKSPLLHFNRVTLLSVSVVGIAAGINMQFLLVNLHDLVHHPVERQYLSWFTITRCLCNAAGIFEPFDGGRSRWLVENSSSSSTSGLLQDHFGQQYAHSPSTAELFVKAGPGLVGKT